MNFGNIKDNKEFLKLIPPLANEDYHMLEKSLLKNGFDDRFGKIKVWFPNGENEGYVIDGHNRLEICKKHNIPLNKEHLELIHFEDRSEVVKWMYENQLARRNLSAVDKYEVAEKYQKFLKERAKQNQSNGGKGLSNLTKVNVRKEKANMIGVSEGTYRKIDTVMKSDNDEVKDKLRKKEISVDKAYKQVTKSEKNPTDNIKAIDDMINEATNRVEFLKDMIRKLCGKRNKLFDALGGCQVKYKFSGESIFGAPERCVFYVEAGEHKRELLDVMVTEKEPESYWLGKVPEKYKNDVYMLWVQAYEEKCKLRAEYEEYRKQLDEAYKIRMKKDEENDKKFYKECYHKLAKVIHPDGGDANAEEKTEAMKILNKLKSKWKI